MPDKNPENYGIIKYGWVVGLAVWGGAVHYLQKMRESGSAFSLTLAFEQFLTSALSGVIAFYACEIAQVNGLAAAIAIAIAGHMGGDFLNEIKHRFINKYLPKDLNNCTNANNKGERK